MFVGFIGNKESASAVSLSTSSNTLQVGGKTKVTLYFYYNKKKPKWSVSNKAIKITRSSKKSCTVKAVKPGSAYVRCKIARKTYKIKLIIKDKSKVTFDNYGIIYEGMSFDDVSKILGTDCEVDYSESHTEEEYLQYWEYAKEDNSWNDYVWRERTRYEWKNPWDNHRIHVTFNDGIVSSKSYY